MSLCCTACLYVGARTSKLWTEITDRFPTDLCSHIYQHLKYTGRENPSICAKLRKCCVGRQSGLLTSFDNEES